MYNQQLIPDNETERMKALHRYEILDTRPEGTFDRVTAIVARLLQVPIAVVSLVDNNRIWFKSRHGLDVQQLNRSLGFCAAAILSPDIYVVTDATKDRRYAENSLVTSEFGLRFYVGAPLQTHDGYSLGTLCAIDKQPRPISPQEMAILNDLAGIVMDEIELRLAARKVDGLNAELAKAKEAAEVANEAKSTFLANMSHELRSPLNAILGFSQLTIRSKNLSPENQENLSIITRSGEHLLALINQVLDLSKIEAGRITLNEQNFDLYRLLDDLEDMFQLKADDKHLHLLFERNPDVPRYVRADRVKLNQVLINLLNNAIKFTSEGGVSVRAAVKTSHLDPAVESLAKTIKKVGQDETQAIANEPPENPAAHPHSTVLCFEVEDTGAGIAPEELDTLFEAFVQTKTGKESQEGTGLGLPISRKFVQLMGGEMKVGSQVGRGTIFQFEIKVSTVDAKDIESKQPSRLVIALEADQPRYRILIVDDKPLNRQLLIKLLNPLGFELKEACNGAEAIAVWDEWEPHLIWMDMRMPVMDGYEATKQIKSTAKGQATAVIALTASVLEEERAVMLSTGCDDFMRKPFRESDIFDAMSKHIGVRFVYEEPVRSDFLTENEAKNALTAAAIAALPPELVADLERAIPEGDLDLIASAIAQIRTQNIPLAGAIENCIDNFDYYKILTLIAESGAGKK